MGKELYSVNKDKRLQAEEKIMEAVCDRRHWPYAYRADGLDEDVLIAEKCEVCKAALVVKETLQEVLPCEA